MADPARQCAAPSVVPGPNRALDALRAIAALTVVVGHARRALLQDSATAGGGAWTDVAYVLTSLERPAVVVFFVLSGYLVGGSVVRETATGAFRWRRYLVNRGVRLWIVLVPALAATVVLDSVGRHLAPEYYKYQAHPLEAADVLGTLFFLQLSAVDVPGTNSPLWSLAFEAGYYLAFPLLYVALLRGSARQRLGAAALLALLVVAPLPAVWVLFPTWLAGAAVAAAEGPLRRTLATWSVSRLRVSRAWVTCCLVLAILVDRATAGPFVHSASAATFVVALFTAGLVALLLGDLHPVRRAARSLLEGLSRLSQSSYSLYVVHAPLLAFGVALTHPVADRSELWPPTVWAWLSVAVAVVVMVVAGHAFAAVTERHTARVRGWVLGQRSRAYESPSRLNPSRS